MTITYEQAIKELSSVGMFYIDLGLERIGKVLEKLGNPQDNLKCIHVAGTNGKGSVCAMLEVVLREAGYKTGLYTSPHIFNYTERIKINGLDITRVDFANYFEEIVNVAKSINVYLTEFEVLTVMMFLYFSRNKVDIVVLETGMGGQFDATNVIKTNLCSIITRIDLDHTDRLGKTKEEIAFEKSGIIKPHCPVVTAMGYEVIRDKADKLDSMLVFTSPFVHDDFVNALALKGLHQIENLSLVITAINYLFKNIDEKTIISALGKVKHHFRFEYFAEKNLIVDASHNPNGINALRENLDYYYPNERRRFVFGCLKTKDYAKMMHILFNDDDEVYLNAFDYPKACSYEDLIKECPVKANEYDANVELTKDKLNIICGSFYMMSEMFNENIFK